MSIDAERQRLNTVGLALSGVCLIHCIALPLVALAIPALTLGLDLQTDHALHWVLLTCAIPISSLALWSGAKRAGDHRWLMLGSVGLAVMAVGVLNVFGTRSEVPFTSFGVTFLAIAHVMNFRLSNRHRHVEAE